MKEFWEPSMLHAAARLLTQAAANINTSYPHSDDSPEPITLAAARHQIACAIECINQAYPDALAPWVSSANAGGESSDSAVGNIGPASSAVGGDARSDGAANATSPTDGIVGVVGPLGSAAVATPPSDGAAGDDGPPGSAA